LADSNNTGSHEGSILERVVKWGITRNYVGASKNTTSFYTFHPKKAITWIYDKVKWYSKTDELED